MNRGGKERKIKYMANLERREARNKYLKAYHKTEKGKASWKKYFNSLKGKASRKKYDEIPINKIRFRLKDTLYQALKTYTKSGKLITSKSYGIDYKKIIEKLKPFPKELKKWHVDHIMPLYEYDLEDPDEVKRAFHPENLQWLTVSENTSKRHKISNIPNYLIFINFSKFSSFFLSSLFLTMKLKSSRFI